MQFHYISWFFIISLIFLRFYSTKPVFKNGDLIRITSKVYGEPIVYDREQYLTLKGLKVYLPKFPEITYGDKIVVEGIIEDKKLNSPKLIKIETDDRGILLNLRKKLINFYKSILPEPHGSLVAGIVIGSKNMPQEFWDKLKLTGTAHIVVASGTNVTMLATFLILSLTHFFKRKTAILITLLGIFCYVVISGFDAPIVRAGIMGSIVFLAQGYGKVSNTWQILIYTILLMLFVKPSWITDLGFILSFVATISLLLFQKKIDLKLQFMPNILREGLSTSLAAQIGVTPILFITFGQFNILSPIINMLVLWTVSYIMILGAIGGLIGLIVPLVGRLILLICFPFLIWFTKILEIFLF